MNRFLATSCLMLMATPVLAQNGQNGAVSTDHQPNAQTVACLEAPTRDCAFTSAIQTVISEEFGVERAKVLVGVARSMIETGQKQEALDTLKLALDEARAVRLSLVTQEKIHDIAPLMAQAGDMAGALALTEEIQNPSIQDKVLSQIAAAAYKRGALSDGRVALKQMHNQTRAFWQRMTLLTLAPRDSLQAVDLETLDAEVRENMRPDLRYRGFVQLAIIGDRMGKAGERNYYLAEADDMFPSVIGIQTRADVTALRARNMLNAGMDSVFVEASYELAMLHGSRLRAKDELASFAEKIGPVEAATGRLEMALKRLDAFQAVAEKARYLASLKASSDVSILAAQVRETLVEVQALPGAYERDIVRLELMEGALDNNDLQLSRIIVEAMEDDDNQALALALMAPMLD
ncbi:MAG: hypothetical protein EP335_03795 [Alphaproteobacteria bacterium]|nr:MAG: hypothetical protein EP335_03795 [Alphaproteobacteria bacterium]